MPVDPFDFELDTNPTRRPRLALAPVRAGHPVDRVTILALRFALESGADFDHTVTQLIGASRGNRATLAGALRRFHTGSEEGRGATAARAAEFVRAAFERSAEARDTHSDRAR